MEKKHDSENKKCEVSSTHSVPVAASASSCYPLPNNDKLPYQKRGIAY